MDANEYFGRNGDMSESMHLWLGKAGVEFVCFEPCTCNLFATRPVVQDPEEWLLFCFVLSCFVFRFLGHKGLLVTANEMDCLRDRDNLSLPTLAITLFCRNPSMATNLLCSDICKDAGRMWDADFDIERDTTRPPLTKVSGITSFSFWHPLSMAAGPTVLQLMWLCLTDSR